VRNQELADSLQKLRIDVDNYKEIARFARHEVLFALNASKL
jgi:hypothetical protein